MGQLNNYKDKAKGKLDQMKGTINEQRGGVAGAKGGLQRMQGKVEEVVADAKIALEKNKDGVDTRDEQV